MVRAVSSNDFFFIGELEGDLRGYMRVFDIVKKTKRENFFLNFVVAYNLMVPNTFFRKKKKSHLVTFNSGQHSIQIDFVLIIREERPNYKNCKVI
jgi:hypothetical protein